MSKPTAVDKFPVMRFSPVNEETGMERDPKGGYVLAQNYEQLLAELEQVKADYAALAMATTSYSYKGSNKQ